jgi:hypothetical protein
VLHPFASQVRAAAKRAAAGKYGSKVDAHQARKEHLSANPMPRSELEDLFLGEEAAARAQQQQQGKQQLLKKQQHVAKMEEEGSEEGDEDDDDLNTEDLEAMLGGDEGEEDGDEEMSDE